MFTLSKNYWLLGAALLWLAVPRTSAAPFAKTIEFTQPNGAVIELWGEGDEFSAFFEHNGYTVVYDAARQAYMYARLNGDESELIATRLEAGSVDPALQGLPQHLRPTLPAIATERAERRARWEQGMEVEQRWQQTVRRMQLERAAGPGLMAPPNFETVGTKVGLTLLIDFDSTPAAIPRAEVIEYLNGENYSGYGNNGSVRQYFADVSKGMLNYTNICTVYVRIPQSLHSRSYYADSSKDSGSQANLLIKDALNILKALPQYESEILPQFESLTLDDSNRVVAMNVFYTGGDGGVWSKGLWPHSWSLLEVGAQDLGNGIKVNKYQITNMGDGLSIGTFCHENGHMLCGYPDFYDYATDGTETIGGTGYFCLMGYGSFDKNPVHVSAYMKLASGWADIVDVVADEYHEATLPSLSVAENPNRIYRYVNPEEDTEYFLLENRQLVERDQQLPAAGIAIWHIDELGDRDNESRDYNSEHKNYEQTLVQADNLWHLHLRRDIVGTGYNYGDANDLWYAGNNAAAYANVFNDNSTPPAKWWDGSNSRLRLEQFSANSENMTFVFEVMKPKISTSATLPTAYVGTPYSYKLNYSGGVAPGVWSVTSNSLPLGLTLDVDSGLIAGLPQEPGTVSFEATITGANGRSDARVFTLLVKPKATIPFVENFDQSTSMPQGWHQSLESNAVAWVFRNGSGTDPSRPLEAFSAPNNARFGITTPSLRGSTTKLISPVIDFGESPYGAELSFRHFMEAWGDDVDRLIVYYRLGPEQEWVPLQTFGFSTERWTKRVITLPETSRSLQVAFEGVARYGYGVHLDDIWIGDPTPPLAIVVPDWLEDAVIDHPYSNRIEAVGGMPPYTFSIVVGSLPTGLTLDAAGIISGTGTTVMEDVPFSVQVEDSLGFTNVAYFTLTVAPPRATWFNEDFETGAFYTRGWTQETLVNRVLWEVQPGGGNAHSILVPQFAHGGQFNATLYWWNDKPERYDNVTRLVSPPINLGVVPTTPRLTFWHCMAELKKDQDSLRVYSRPSATAPWTLLATYTNSVTQWTKRTLDLPNPSSTYYIAFEGNARYGAGISIDDVRIWEDAPAPRFGTGTKLPDATIWLDYEAQIEAAGGIGPYTFEASGSPAAPAWLTIDPDGRLHGTPDEAGIFEFGVKVIGIDGAYTEHTYRILVRAGLRLPYTQGFEGGEELPDGWRVEAGTAAKWVWRRGSPSGLPNAPHSGSVNACFYSRQYFDVKKKLIMPMVNLTTGVDNPTLSFWLHMEKWGADQDVLNIYYMTSPTNSSWTLLQTIATNVNKWTQYTIALPNPTDSYIIAFEGVANYGYGICLDDVKVSGDITTSGFDQWAIEQFGEDAIDPSIADPNADPDGDGVPNVWEYISGSDPNDPSDGQRVGLRIELRDGRPFISFPLGKQAALDGVTWWLETCTDLLVWSWVPLSGVEVLPRAEELTWWQIIYDTQLPINADPHRFFRLKAELP